MLTVLALTLIPALLVFLAGAAGLRRAPGAKLISLFQHFAAGVVFAAVAVELMPVLYQINHPWRMAAGFLLGVGLMLFLDQISNRLGFIVPVGVDLFIDGMLVAIGFATGVMGGLIILLGLSLETVALGLSLAPSLKERGMPTRRVLRVLMALGAALLTGSLVGHTAAGHSAQLLAALLGFGVAALLYLVTEELLKEAHETKDTPPLTASFFIGFLLPCLLAAMAR